MTTASERLLQRLDNVKQTAGNQWLASCPGPAHKNGDRNPSLSVRQVEGQALLYCHAGDPMDSVLAALDLGLGDLFDNQKSKSYVYFNLDGSTNRTVTREVKADGKKNFPQSGHKGQPAVLFRLPAVVEAVESGRTIYLVEGEKDAEVLGLMGEVATTAPMGAGSWKLTDYQPLVGARRIVIVQDKDTAGRKRGIGVTEHLRRLSPKSDVLLVESLTESPGADLTDHIMAGHSLDTLVQVEVPEAVEAPQTRSEPRRMLKVTKASDVRIERPRWALQEFLPLGVISILAGFGGQGKSTLSLYWAAQATQGKLQGDFLGIPRNVVVIATEESKSMQVARLKAADADLERIRFVDLTFEGSTSEGRILFPQDLHLLRDLVLDQEPLLIIIDPITGSVPGNQWRSDEVRDALEPVHGLAQELDLSVLGLAHFTKGAGKSQDKLSGSHAYRDVVRSYLPLAADLETGLRHLTIDKSNYSTKAGQSYQFTLKSVDIPAADGGVFEVGTVANFQESDTSADMVINRGVETEEGTEERLDSQRFILDYLTELGGSAEAREVLKFGQAAGFSENSLKKARARIRNPRVKSNREGFGKNSRIFWILDEAVNPQDIGAAIGAIGAASGNKASMESMGTYDSPKISQGVNNQNSTPSEDTSTAPLKWDPTMKLVAPDALTQTALGTVA